MGEGRIARAAKRIRGRLSAIGWRPGAYGSVAVGVALLLSVGGVAAPDATPDGVTAVRPSATRAATATTVAATATPQVVTAAVGATLRSRPAQILEETPAPVPTPREQPSARGGERPTGTPDTIQERFIADVAAAAQTSQQETGVPASVTLAQAMLESDLGRSALAQEAKNYFGIKASGSPGPAGVVYMDTREVIGGASVTVRAPFRAYNTVAESFTDHGLYLRDTPRYAEAMKHTDDPRLFARLIQQAGYATDPQYAAKLIRLMDTYNLYQYDR